jgi:hypothetical protein
MALFSDAVSPSTCIVMMSWLGDYVVPVEIVIASKS